MRGKVVTADAMHCQLKWRSRIDKAATKSRNQGSRRDDGYFWTTRPRRRSQISGHGRIETRIAASADGGYRKRIIGRACPQWAK